MNIMADLRPIAVMDTGVGGLSVVNVLHNLAPREQIHYFADTAHLPYGIKSPALIKHLAKAMAQRLVAMASPKVLVVACHTISVWYLKELQALFDIPVIGMVQPSLKGLGPIIKDHQIKSLAILSTRATVDSGAYRNNWAVADPQNQVQLVEHACGPLVSIVEEGNLAFDDLVAINNHLLPGPLKNSDALLIGCTHFSAMKPVLEKILKPHCLLVDAADLVAAEVLQMLERNGQLSNRPEPQKLKVYVSDNVERFSQVARTFIDGDLDIELSPTNKELYE
jgi:glutamate racemase